MAMQPSQPHHPPTTTHKLKCKLIWLQNFSHGWRWLINANEQIYKPANPVVTCTHQSGRSQQFPQHGWWSCYSGTGWYPQHSCSMCWHPPLLTEGPLWPARSESPLHCPPTWQWQTHSAMLTGVLGFHTWHTGTLTVVSGFHIWQWNTKSCFRVPQLTQCNAISCFRAPHLRVEH